MDPKTGLLVAGGLGLVGVVAIAMAGGGKTVQGVTFAAPDPSSVAAVQSAGAADVASVNALSAQRSAIASQTILGLAQLQEQLGLGTLAARSTDLQTGAAAESVALQQASSVHAVDVAGNVANYSTMIGGNVANFAAQTTADTTKTVSANTLASQNYQTQVNAQSVDLASNNALTAALKSIQAQLQATSIQANAGIAEAASAANAAVVQSNNATTQAQAAAGAQKTSSFWNFLGTAAGALSSAFGVPKVSAPAPTSTSNPGVVYA